MSAENQTQSRADRIRQRRSQRRNKHGFLGRSRAAKPASSARDVPIFVRHSTTAMPVKPNRRVRTRRRFDIALSAPGAELRLPALPTARLSMRLVSGALVAILLALLYNLWNGPAYRVDSIEAEGLKRISSAQVSQVLAVSDQPVFSIDPVRLQAELAAAFPEFSQVNVSVAFPDRLLVRVEERVPVLVLNSPAGSLLVDKDGVALPPRQNDTELPVVEATYVPQGLPAGDTPKNPENQPNRILTADMISAILALRKLTPQETVLLIDEEHGLGWKDRRGWQVYFGNNLSDFDQKMQVYRALVKHLKAEGLEPALVSVEYLHAPFYRLDR